MFVYIIQPTEPLGKGILLQKKGKKKAVQSPKGRQLSHILYGKIVEIINSGELSEELCLKQVMITSVSFLNVFLTF